MMQQEFEKLAGYEVSTSDYHDIIEPMYMAVNLSKQEFVKVVDKKRFALKTKSQIISEIDRKFVDGAVHCGFMSAKELPEGATPFLALSNGRIATCYFVNDGETITIYRPNPNSRLYDPLELYADIGHRHQYGLY